MRYIPVIFGVVLIIYGLIDCLRSEPRDVRSIPKIAWAVVILVLPLIGVILWFIYGRPQYARSSTTSARTGSRPSAATKYLAPDDDPAFLRNLESERIAKAEAERLRKLREQHPNDENKH